MHPAAPIFGEYGLFPWMTVEAGTPEFNALKREIGELVTAEQQRHEAAERVNLTTD